LILAQSMSDAEFARDGCYDGERMFLNYGIEPFVVRSGEIVTRKTTVMAEKKGDKYKISKDGSILVAASAANRDGKSYRVKLCLAITFTTPGSEYETKIVSQFKDELERGSAGYIDYSTPDGAPPTVLVKRTRIIFSLE
jgi:hypothetical protein